MSIMCCGKLLCRHCTYIVKVGPLQILDPCYEMVLVLFEKTCYFVNNLRICKHTSSLGHTVFVLHLSASKILHISVHYSQNTSTV